MSPRKKLRDERRPRASGRFVMRVEPSLHAALRDAAAAAGVSLNEYCVGKLAQPGALAAYKPSRAIVSRCASLFGSDLVGIAVFGSWARGDNGPNSDVDVLIVLGATWKVTRALYRQWDEQPLTWDGRPVEPHFVQLPSGDSVGSLWAEASIDGLVLFERGLELSRQLAEIRRRIVAGRLVRRIVHGQPYWAEVA